MNLHELIAQGEGQFLDYKQELPSGENLGKVIASFATCGGGQIVVGVTKEKYVIGLTVDEDKFRSDVDNVANQVHPQCRCLVSFEKYEGEKTVAIISVDKGTRPIYYYGFKPRIRRDTVSDPATPEEVEKLVLEYYFLQGMTAVRTELKLIETFVEQLMDILELPTDAWKDLIKRAASENDVSIVNKLSNVYSKILICNSIGMRVGYQIPVDFSIKPHDPVREFCLFRKDRILLKSFFINAYDIIDDYIAHSRGYRG